MKRKKDNICSTTNKRAYPTEGVAKSELAWCKMLKLHGDETYTQVRYYKCNFCHMFHLTSQEEKNVESVEKTETDS